MADAPRSCVTCEWRMGRGRFAKCAHTGHYISTETAPTFASISLCGPRLKAWHPRRGVLQRLRAWLLGY